ncbi:MAG TPA: hypothetical protein VIY98_08570, partial [Nitrososphaeraceae archaeon]
MTSPSGYQRPNKKNLDDKTDLSNNPDITTKNENDTINPIPTTIGEAVKEVIETGKEVVIEGPQTAGELAGVKEGDLEEKNIDHTPKQRQNDKTELTDVRKDSKLEIDLIESPNETRFLSKEEKIIVNPQESKTDTEAIITTVTTIPAEGVDVEAQTEFTVPLKDKEENIEVETDVKVNPTTTSSVSRLESRNIEKPNLSLTDELSREKNTPQSEFDKETINPKLLLEKEEHRLQQQNTSNFSSNPFITYSAFW